MNQAKDDLSKVDPQNVSPLIAALNDETSEVRMSAAEALGKIGDPKVVSALISALNHCDRRVFTEFSIANGMDIDYYIPVARNTIEQIADPSSIPLLRAFLEDANNKIKAKDDAIYLLGVLLKKFPDIPENEAAKIISILVSYFNYHESTRNPGYSREPIARKALETLKDQRSILPLIAFLEGTTNTSIGRGDAAELLGSLISNWPDTPEETINKAITALTVTLEDQEANLRRSAIEALGKIANHKAVPALISALKDKSAEVRSWAAIALRSVPDPQSIPALIHAFNGKEKNVREDAAITLGTIKASQAVPIFISALKDEDKHFVSCVASALGMIGDPQAIPALIPCLNYQYAKRYAYSYMALSIKGAIESIADPGSIPLLIAFLENTSNTAGGRSDAADLLSTLLSKLPNTAEEEIKKVFDVLTPFSTHEDKHIRKMAKSSLRKIKPMLKPKKSKK